MKAIGKSRIKKTPINHPINIASAKLIWTSP